MDRPTSPSTRPTAPISRRRMLSLLGGGVGAAAAAPLLDGCVVESGTASGTGSSSAANDVTGSFDWKKAKGTTLRILQTPHPYQQSFAPMLKEFTELTGV